MPQSANVRMQKILHRTCQLRRKRERITSCFFSAACLLLTGSLAVLLRQWHRPGLSVVFAGYSSVLLHSGTDAYIVVGVASFVIGVLFTLLCFRYKRRAALPRRTSSDAREDGISPNQTPGS